MLTNHAIRGSSSKALGALNLFEDCGAPLLRRRQPRLARVCSSSAGRHERAVLEAAVDKSETTDVPLMKRRVDGPMSVTVMFGAERLAPRLPPKAASEVINVRARSAAGLSGVQTRRRTCQTVVAVGGSED